jgi:hypothetical protein
MSNAIVKHKNGEVTHHKVVWNNDKKIYEVFPKVSEDELYWNNCKQINIEYK